MSTRITFSPSARRSLNATGERYPFAYGYLWSIVRGYLEGTTSREHLEEALEALESALEGEHQ